MFLLLSWRQATQGTQNLVWLLRKHGLRSYMTWLPVTLSVRDMIIVYVWLAFDAQEIL